MAQVIHVVVKVWVRSAPMYTIDVIDVVMADSSSLSSYFEDIIFLSGLVCLIGYLKWVQKRTLMSRALTGWKIIWWALDNGPFMGQNTTLWSKVPETVHYLHFSVIEWKQSQTLELCNLYTINLIRNQIILYSSCHERAWPGVWA